MLVLVHFFRMRDVQISNTVGNVYVLYTVLVLIDDRRISSTMINNQIDDHTTASSSRILHTKYYHHHEDITMASDGLFDSPVIL